MAKTKISANEKARKLADINLKDMQKPGKVYLLRKCRVHEHGVTGAKAFAAGDVVNVSGKDKFELLSGANPLGEWYDEELHGKGTAE